MTDLDQQVLLWFSVSCAEDAFRTAVFETMAITWPEWEVRWAAHREHGLTEYCAGRWRRCLVSVSGMGCYAPTVDLASLIAQGPALVDMIAGWKQATRIAAVTVHGSYLDPAQQSGALWALDGTFGELAAIAAPWDGWTWEDWGHRFAEVDARHECSSGSEIAAAFAALSQSFDQHQLVDTGTEAIGVLMHATDRIKEAARAAGLTVEAVEDNTFGHRPIELSAAELADTCAAIAGAQLRLGS